MVVEVKLDSALRVRRVDLPPGVAAQIRERLTIRNEAKVVAKQRGDWGADDMPDAFELWGDVGEELVMMRGFAAELRAGLEAMGHEVVWRDCTSYPPLPLRWLVDMRAPKLTEDQEESAQEILRHRQGNLQAPTGSGKTVLGLDVWRRAGTTGLVLVNNIGLAEQWRQRAIEHLGVEPGFIGDGKWDEQPLTIAMVPTLFKRLEQLDQERFWERWGMTIVDESHHVVARSYREVISRSCSRYLLGKTATPLDKDWRQPMLLFTLGPVFHRAGAKMLKPLVQVVHTGFKWDPTNSEKRLRDPRAIYRHVIDSLMRDNVRVSLIARTIVDQPESCAQLVVSKRLEYLDKIYEFLRIYAYPEDCIFFMRGQESRERRAEIAELAGAGSCVILATVADEGTDIPRLDRLHIVWPQRRELTLIQQIGRVVRKHPDKREAVVFDYADLGEGMLRGQFYARRQVYVDAGYAIDGLEQAETRR